MIRALMSFFGLHVTTRFTSSLGYLTPRLCGGMRTIDKVASTWPRVKENNNLANRARSLIFGEKKYVDLTPEEQKIVDFYQQKKLEEDGVILPNTRAALEQEELEQILRKRLKDRE